MPGIMHWAIMRYPRYSIKAMCRTWSSGIESERSRERLRRSEFTAETVGVASRPFYWLKDRGVYWAIE